MKADEKDKLLTKTDARPAEFLSDVHEYDGRQAKQEFIRRTQNDGRVHQKRCY
jgi:hypothetical protein